MSAPDRPTREQVDTLRAELRAALDEVAHPNQITVDQDALIEILDRLDEQDAGHAAEVRALRAELDALSDEDRAEQIAALIVDKVRAQVARTPQPAETVRVGDPCPWDGPDGVHEAGTGRDREECRYCDGTIAPSAPLPAVPDGEDAPETWWSPSAGCIFTDADTGPAAGVQDLDRFDDLVPLTPAATGGEDVPARLDAAAAALGAISPAWETAADYFRMAAEELREGPWPEDVRAAVAAALARPTGGETNG